MDKKCIGSCAYHVGEVKKYVISGWDGTWDYCEEAFAEDKRRGLNIELAEDNEGR